MGFVVLGGNSQDFPTNDFATLEQGRVAGAARELLSRFTQAGPPTLGIELEFFLRDRQSRALCGLQQSQEFLLNLAQNPDWEVFLKNKVSDKVVRVSRSFANGRFHSVKYEHPPHMLEIALAYESNLSAAYESLHESLSDLFIAARAADVEIDLSGCVEPPAICWETVGMVESRFEQLSKSRRKILGSLKQAVLDHSKDPRIDFTAFTAATQYHIGGIQWWEQDPAFLDRLYRAEYLISGRAYQGSRGDFEARWSSYRYVFGEMKLLGFPDLPAWSFDRWVQGLVESPWIEGSGRVFGDKVPALSEEDLLRVLPNVRDLQIVKPKWIGTLEYRSDPATSDVGLLIRNAALRFGAYLASLNAPKALVMAEPTFSELARSWWSGSHIDACPDEMARLEGICYETLRARGLGEEKFL